MKALIWKEDVEEIARKAGKLERVGTEEELLQTPEHYLEKLQLVDFPEELEGKQPHELSAELVDGNYVISEDQEYKKLLKMQEFKSMREPLLAMADVELKKHEDSDPKAVAAMEDWKAYRIALRDCTEQFKKVDGGVKVAILTADLLAALPTKPV